MVRWSVRRSVRSGSLVLLLAMLLTACGTSSGDKTATAGGAAKPTTAAVASPATGAATTAPTTGAAAVTTAPAASAAAPTAAASTTANATARPAGTTPAGSAVAASGTTAASPAASGTSAASSAAAPTAAPPPPKPVPQPVASGLGSEAKPITMYFVPSEQVDKLTISGKQVAADMEKLTGLKFKTAVPTSYGAVVESMGSGDADVAWLATFAYVLAHQKYGVNVGLTTTRNGLDTYKGEIIARADSGINSIKDCNGKTVAWTDAASASGYVYPSALFASQGVKPGKELFAGGHPQAVLAIYQGTADCAGTFYSPDNPDGSAADSRASQIKTYPDILQKVKIVGFTPDIPNDTVSFRKDFPPDLQKRIVDAFLYYASTPESKQPLNDVGSITGFVRSDDSRYQIVRDSLNALGKKPEDFFK